MLNLKAAARSAAELMPLSLRGQQLPLQISSHESLMIKTTDALPITTRIYEYEWAVCRILTGMKLNRLPVTGSGCLLSD
jgi:hypothetical protein